MTRPRKTRPAAQKRPQQPGLRRLETWKLQDAKAKFSELLEKANSEGPQKITKHGRTTAVVVAAEEWERKAERKGNLAEFLASSPLRGSGLKIRRLPMRLRKVEL